jgi:hypothetical protein
VVHERTAQVHTLTALLAVAYTVGAQRGTFDLIVNYAAPDVLRFTALKDSVLSTQILFDLLLQGEGYRFLHYDDYGALLHQGTVQDFVQAYPTFRTFALVGEAFFLPGTARDGQLPQVNSAGTRLTSELRHGVQAQWVSRPDTLEILRACLRWPSAAGSIALTLRYQDYRLVDGLYLPHRVMLKDQRQGFMTRAVVKEVAVNVTLAPEALELTP